MLSLSENLQVIEIIRLSVIILSNSLKQFELKLFYVRIFALKEKMQKEIEYK
jgi:hypothetical protein